MILNIIILFIGGESEINDKNVNVTLSCDMCQECVKIAEPKDVLEVSGDSTKFIFSVESISRLDAEQIILSSVDILKKKVKDFQKELKKLK